MSARAQLADIVGRLMKQRGITIAALACRLNEYRRTPSRSPTGGKVDRASTTFYRALRGSGPWPAEKVDLLVKALRPDAATEERMRALYPDASTPGTRGRRRGGPSPAKVEALGLVDSMADLDDTALPFAARLRELITEHMN